MNGDPVATAEPAAGVQRRHPTIFEPATLILLTVLCVVGAIIGMQLLVTLGVTANTSIVGALIAMALARVPLRAFARAAIKWSPMNGAVPRNAVPVVNAHRPVAKEHGGGCRR